MPKSGVQLDREIAGQIGERAYYQEHARIGDSSDPRLDERAAFRAAEREVRGAADRDAFVAAWIAARNKHLSERAIAEKTLAARATKMGAEAYNATHARVGDSRDAALGERAARQAAAKAFSRGQEQDLFVGAWLAARERHFRERLRYGREPYVPLPGLD